MRVITTWLVFLCLFKASGVLGQNTYYIKQTGGSGDGLSDATAWGVDKLNSTVIPEGSTVLFKRGDTFNFTLNVKQSNITYGAYGKGAGPVISGFTVLKKWVLLKDKIYYATVDAPSINMVTLDGAVKSMGRYPKKGYLAYTAHDDKLSISGPSVKTIPFDPTGGEMVIRKERWILDRHPITSRSGDKISYSINTNYGNNGVYTPKDNNGYFIQAHLGTLTTDGDWYYDAANKRLYMFFGSSQPDKRIVKASVLAQNVQLNVKNNVTFNDLTFEGANITGAWSIGSSKIAYNNCNWRYQGGDAIWGGAVTDMSINGGSITNALNNGVRVEYGGSNVLVNKVKVSNTGTIAGAGRSGDGVYIGIFVFGKNTKITNCTVINSGYNAIDFSGGDNALVEHNLVDTFCTVKDDGGGIYTHSGANSTINENIVLNGIGAYPGAEWSYWEAYGKAAGIYLDNGTTDHFAKVTNNTVAHGGWAGIFINSNGNNTLTGNVAYDHLYSLLIGDITKPRKNTISNNQFISKKKKQYPLYIDLAQKDDVRLFGLFNNNIYARPIDDSETFGVYENFQGGSRKHMSISDWKKISDMDVNSKGSSAAISNEDQLLFQYNSASAAKKITLRGTYKDLNNNAYKSSVVLKPFTSIVLIRK